MKLLTEFDGNPKVLGVGLAGAGLYARALAYCGKYETDGFIPAVWVKQAVASEGLSELPKQMLSSGLWKTAKNDKDGYEIKDYLEVNRSKSEMESLRESRSTAGKKGGQAKPKAKRKQKESKSHSSSNSLSKSSSKKDLDELPAGFDSKLGEVAKRVCPILRRTAEARSAKPVHLLPVARAVEQFPKKDHVAVAGSVEHWLVHGNGSKRPAKDVVARFRNFLSDSPDVEVAARPMVDRSRYDESTVEARV